MTWQEQWRQNKAALVDARNRGDDEAAKLLSQERQKLKGNGESHCGVCGVIIKRIWPHPGERCAVHRRDRLTSKMAALISEKP